MTTAIYARVSSERQDLASQLPDIERWIAAFADDEVVWYTDKFSGKTMDRPGWLKLKSALDVGKINKVVVWRLDRLGRTAAGLTALFDEFTKKGIEFVSIKDGIDLSTAAGRLMANVLASVAAYDNEVRAERILAGQAAARAKGKTWGGSKKGRRLKVTDEQIDTINRMNSEGKGKTAMARATGLSRQTVYTLLDSQGESR